MTALFPSAPRRWPLDDVLPSISHLPDGARDCITDLSHLPRLGLRGQGTARVAIAMGLPLPDAVNAATVGPQHRVLRLGAEEVLVLSDPLADASPVPDLYREWAGAPGPKGFDAYREETWAWVSLCGPGVLSSLPLLTAIDTRAALFQPGALRQTRALHMDVVLYRSDWGGAPSVDLFFDVASSDFALLSLRDILPGFAAAQLRRDADQ